MDDITQKYIAEKLADLLAASTLSDEMKDLIVENSDKLPDYLVFDLIKALEEDRDKLGELMLKIEEFAKNQDEDWKNLEEDQMKAVDEILEEEMGNLEA